MQKIHGSAGAFQNLTSDIQYYIVYAKCNNAFTDPSMTSGIDILVTNDISDVSQKNFEILLQSVALRAMPVMMNNPTPVANLANEGAPSLSGEGYIWKFACEFPEAFTNYGPNGTLGNVGLLIDELHGVVLFNGVVLKTVGSDKNIEFVKTNLL